MFRVCNWAAAVTMAAAVPVAPAQADEPLRRAAAALFGRIEAAAAPALAAPEVELGRALFWDVRMSSDGKTACASCHTAADWGADRRRASVTARGKPTPRHAPTVFNAMRQPMLRWLGDHKNGADLAEALLTGPLGFASKDEAVAQLAQLDYGRAFRTAFPGEAEPLSAANYGRALAAYQAMLVTPAPFDRFLSGNDAALSARQKAGLRAFIATGCGGCHNGPLLGGTSLQRFGIVRDYGPETGSANIDLGRYAVTKKDEDRYVFRVPMLRNVAKTAPYFHDGSVERLDDAVRVMASVQLGRTLDAQTVAAIAAFLESLSGAVPSHFAPPASQVE
jgi:cytochrome c peroxidase